MIAIPGAPPDAPYFDDLQVGQALTAVPSVTLTEGAAAVHRSIVGGRLALTLDPHLSARVTGHHGTLASPALVWDTAIGQSTAVTQRVVANLFYRGLQFHRTPLLGDTLRTVTTVEGLRANAVRAGHAPTGMAALRITTHDQDGRLVLDFWRCAMLPCRGTETDGRRDDLGAFGRGEPDFAAAVTGWDGTKHTSGVEAYEGQTWDVVGGDVVSSASELARLTQNVAMVHHDRTINGERLVYGGHTIGLALHQASRVLPTMLTVTGWHSCDHTGPVREGDTLTSHVTLERSERLEKRVSLFHIRSVVRAACRGQDPHDVLDWRFVAAIATS